MAQKDKTSSVSGILLGCLLLSGLTTFVTARFFHEPENPKTHTRWEEIKERGTLRCGYINWPPFVERDMLSKKMKGPAVAIIEKMASNLALKVDWVVEVDLAHMLSGFDKYDMVCSPVVSNSFRARQSDFTSPFGYIGTYAWVREKETRFGNNLEALNDPQVRIVVIDGESSQEVAKEDFPKAKLVTLPHIAAGGQLMMEVAANKADVVLTEAFSMELYAEKNPNQIRALSKTPVRVSGLAFPLPPDEYALKNALDIALRELRETSTIDRLLKPYEKGMARILPPAKLYQE